MSKKKIVIEKLKKGEHCSYCFQTNRKQQEEYKIWAYATRNNVVLDKSKKPI